MSLKNIREELVKVLSEGSGRWKDTGSGGDFRPAYARTTDRAAYTDPAHAKSASDRAAAYKGRRPGYGTWHINSANCHCNTCND
jgi:hypothetical protein